MRCFNLLNENVKGAQEDEVDHQVMDIQEVQQLLEVERGNPEESVDQREVEKDVVD